MTLLAGKISLSFHDFVDRDRVRTCPLLCGFASTTLTKEAIFSSTSRSTSASSMIGYKHNIGEGNVRKDIKFKSRDKNARILSYNCQIQDLQVPWLDVGKVAVEEDGVQNGSERILEICSLYRLELRNTFSPVSFMTIKF